MTDIRNFFAKSKQENAPKMPRKPVAGLFELTPESVSLPIELTGENHLNGNLSKDTNREVEVNIQSAKKLYSKRKRKHKLDESRDDRRSSSPPPSKKVKKELSVKPKPNCKKQPMLDKTNLQRSKDISNSSNDAEITFKASEEASDSKNTLVSSAIQNLNEFSDESDVEVSNETKENKVTEVKNQSNDTPVQETKEPANKSDCEKEEDSEEEFEVEQILDYKWCLATVSILSLKFFRLINEK